MRDLNLLDAGCEPARGPRAVVTIFRRGIRRVLRPTLVRLAEILNNLADRLDAADHRFAAIELWIQGDDHRVGRAERRLDALETRSEIAGNRLEASIAKIDHTEHRVDLAEARLDTSERNNDILFAKVEGLRVHLAGLTEEHHGLNSEFAARVAELRAVGNSIGGLDRRQDELDEKLQAFSALHWDHVALARRLAVIEDLLAGSPETGRNDDTEPSIPFPGLEDDARSRVG